MADLFRSRLCVLDTETTGLPRDPWANVVELAAVILDRDGSEIAAWSSLVIPPELDERAAPALEINHLTIEEIRARGVDAFGAAQSFEGWMSQHGSPWVTAYNVDFDREMLRRMGWTSSRWASCVMERAKAEIGVQRWLKLSAAAEHYGVAFEGAAHRALTDARVAAGVACAIRRAELARAAA